VAPLRGILFDYGGTLVEEVGADLRSGHEWLLAQASYRPPETTWERVLQRAARITHEVLGLREHVHLETPWPTVTRLIYEYLGVRFDVPMADLEMGFWKASVETRPMPGAREALDRLHGEGVPMGVVSNSSFGAPVIRYELDKHGLADHLAFVMVSADYSVRKPNALLFETAAARLGVAPGEAWFVGDRLDRDVIGARSAGMTAVWFNRNADSDPGALADIVVTGWDDFMVHWRHRAVEARRHE
jgi:HAD superfamily hydrolase (TIGR01662 family)